MSSALLKKHCPLDKPSQLLLQKAVDRFGLSARAYFRLIRLARTIADLEESETIGEAHVAEALQYRKRE